MHLLSAGWNTLAAAAYWTWHVWGCVDMKWVWFCQSWCKWVEQPLRGLIVGDIKVVQCPKNGPLFNPRWREYDSFVHCTILSLNCTLAFIVLWHEKIYSILQLIMFSWNPLECLLRNVIDIYKDNICYVCIQCTNPPSPTYIPTFIQNVTYNIVFCKLKIKSTLCDSF